LYGCPVSVFTCIFALSFENELDYHYLYVRINSSNDQATSDINVLGFWSVPPEFTHINSVHQAYFSTRVFWVCLSTFYRWPHSYVSLLLVRGQHCGAKRAIHKALPRISSIKSGQTVLKMTFNTFNSFKMAVVHCLEFLNCDFNIIIYFQFHENLCRGFQATVSRKLPFPISCTLAMVFYNSQWVIS